MGIGPNSSYQSNLSRSFQSVIESYQFGFTYYDGIVQTNLKMGGDDSQSGFTGIPTKQDTVKSAKQ